MPVHFDAVLIEFGDRGHRSKFMLTGGNESSTAIGMADLGLARAEKQV